MLKYLFLISILFASTIIADDIVDSTDVVPIADSTLVDTTITDSLLFDTTGIDVDTLTAA